MNLTIPIYQRKTKRGELLWCTLALGEYSHSARGRSPVKVQTTITNALKRRIQTLRPGDMRVFEMSRGIKLERVRIELTLGHGGTKNRVSGKVPLILEPLTFAEGQQVTLCYHPLRQHEWFPFRDQATLAEDAKVFFADAWSGLEAWQTDALLTDGRDMLRVFAFTARAPTLLDAVSKRDDPFADLELDPARVKGAAKKGKPRRRFPELSKLGEDVTLRAADGRLRPGLPRSGAREELARLLTGEHKRSAVVLGAPGVGKTTVIHRAVHDLLDADDYPGHQNLDRVHRVLTLSGKRLIAGMHYVGQWEERVMKILNEVRGEPVIVWVTDLHTFGRVGQSRDSKRAVADLLRGPVARGDLTLIGEATEAQWERLRDDAPAFAEAFSTVRVSATTTTETLNIMLHEARRLEFERGVSFAPFAYQALLETTTALYGASSLPGSALTGLRRLVRYGSSQVTPVGDVTEIDAYEVITMLSERTGLPDRLLDATLPLRPASVKKELGARVMGQPQAIDAATDVIMRVHAGVTDPGRPYATYLFTGPTGTGKTELAKALATYLFASADRLLRFDMGEFSAPDAAARLIGDRYSPKGLLTEAIRQTPFSVVLFDEIEKAHRSVLYLLLQLFDEGRLTDAAGNVASFRHTVVVMTSNLGSDPRAGVGFGTTISDGAQSRDRAVKQYFPPELFNRIDRVVPFSPLSEETAGRIAQKELAQLLARRGLLDRNVFVFANAGATDRIVREAFDARDGARSVKRYLERTVGALLAEELAGTPSAEMRIVRVFDTGEGYALNVEALREAEPIASSLRLAPLLEQNAAELRDQLRPALTFVEETLNGPKLEAIDEQLRDHLRQVTPGEREHADAVHQLEAMRSQLAEFRDRLDGWVHHGEWLEEAEQELEIEQYAPATPAGRMEGTRRARLLFRDAVIPRAPRESKHAILEALAETWFLERALDQVGEPDRHHVHVELLRVGQGADRVVREGLLEWMARAYVGARGECVAVAARLPDGTVIEARPTEGVSARTVLDGLLEQHPVHLVMQFAGLCVRDFFEGEHGCHVSQSLLRSSEVLRVAVLPSRDETPEACIERHVSAASRFEEALSQGEIPLPTNPAGLLPCVRRITFDPPLRPGETAPLELVDYRLGHQEHRRVAKLEDALPRVFWLRMSRVDS